MVSCGPHPCQNLMLLVFGIWAPLISMSWDIVVLLCESLMTYDVDCHFVGLFAGCCGLNIYAFLKFYPNASVLRVGFGFQK